MRSSRFTSAASSTSSIGFSTNSVVPSPRARTDNTLMHRHSKARGQLHQLDRLQANRRLPVPGSHQPRALEPCHHQRQCQCQCSLQLQTTSCSHNACSGTRCIKFGHLPAAHCATRRPTESQYATAHTSPCSLCRCVLCWLRCCYLNSQITEFAPRVRTLSSRDFLNLNWDNIKKHPFSLIACSVFWFLYFVALYLAVRRDRQLLSQLKQRQQQPGDDSTTAGVIEMASLSSNTIVDEAQIPLSKSAAEKRDSSVRRCWRWFKQSRVGRSFRNQHLWLSIALRPSNARLSSQDRLLCVLVLILTSMCCSAIFFGNGSAVHLTSS